MPRALGVLRPLLHWIDEIDFRSQRDPNAPKPPCVRSDSSPIIPTDDAAPLASVYAYLVAPVLGFLLKLLGQG